MGRKSNNYMSELARITAAQSDDATKHIPSRERVKNIVKSGQDISPDDVPAEFTADDLAFAFNDWLGLSKRDLNNRMSEKHLSEPLKKRILALKAARGL